MRVRRYFAGEAKHCGSPLKFSLLLCTFQIHLDFQPAVLQLGQPGFQYSALNIQLGDEFRTAIRVSVRVPKLPVDLLHFGLGFAQFGFQF